MTKNSYVGIDYGTVRLGLAISLENSSISFPLCTINVKKFSAAKKVKEVKKVLESKRIHPITFVIGVPVKREYKINKMADEINEFSKELKKEFEIKIHFIDEVFSSKLAKSMKTSKDKKPMDSLSAKIILDSFLRKQ